MAKSLVMNFIYFIFAWSFLFTYGENSSLSLLVVGFWMTDDNVDDADDDGTDENDEGDEGDEDDYDEDG